MKYLIATDIHGSANSAKIIKEKFEALHCDKILLLGDILYHGPRNDLPESYNPKEVFATLNTLSEKIICVRGNCDAEVDQMVLDFVINDNYLLKVNNTDVFLTHGHKFNYLEPNNALKEGSILIHGHTHIIRKDVVNRVTYINLGSITLPKDGTPKCYALLDETSLVIYDLDDNEVLRHTF